MSLLGVWGFYWGWWSDVYVLSGIQEAVRMRKHVQVSCISHLFLGSRGLGIEMSSPASLEYPRDGPDRSFSPVLPSSSAI